MNFLPLILSILLILTFGSSVILEKQVSSRKLRSSYLGHLKANRKILAKCEAKTYQQFQSMKKTTEKSEKTTEGKKKKIIPFPRINPECARLNLWPLIQDGRNEHPFLYSTAASLLKTLYRDALFPKNERFEYHLLDVFLKKMKVMLQSSSELSLEKIDLGDQVLQRIFYKMLKGTKHGTILNYSGYPSLLDVVRIDETPSKICLFHAHPDQISTLFGPKAAISLFAQMHQEKPPVLSRELIERICFKNHISSLDPDVFDLIELGRPKGNHRTKKTTWIEEDSESNICLRKNIYSGS